MESIGTRVGEAIQRERVERHLSRKTFAGRVGCSVQNLWRIETGVGDTPLSTLERIAEALEMDPADLLRDYSMPRPDHDLALAIGRLLSPAVQNSARGGRLLFEGWLQASSDGESESDTSPSPVRRQRALRLKLELSEGS